MLDLSLKRRTFLRIVTAGGVVAIAPWSSGCGNAGSTAEPLARFFTAGETTTFAALAEAIVPEGGTVGALGSNAIQFIDFFLAAFDNDLPPIYARGPFSGRQPFPGEDGGPSSAFPENEFEVWRPLSRLQELSMRIELYGSASVLNGDINAPLVPTSPGLRSLYREAAKALDAWAQAHDFADLAAVPLGQRLAAIDATPTEFRTEFVKHVLQGMFAAPEYGGNQDGVAWRDYQYDGDSQPIGHTFYDPATESERDNPEKPNQIRDPRWPGGPLEPSVESFIATITLVQGGTRFY